MKDLVEIRWHGRGGQGAKTAALLLADAAFHTGKYILNYMPKTKLPVTRYLELQGRFAHMFKPGNEWMIEQIQNEVDRSWEDLLTLCNP